MTEVKPELIKPRVAIQLSWDDTSLDQLTIMISNI
jgi:hypothetical protein